MSTVAELTEKAVAAAGGATSAIVEQNTPTTPSSDSSTGTIVGASALFLAAVTPALLALRRRLSRDSVEATKDRVEGALLDAVMKERDAAVARADKAIAQSTLDAGTIAGLTERNRYLSDELARVNAAFEKLEVQFEAMKKTLENLTAITKAPVDAPLPPPLNPIN